MSFIDFKSLLPRTANKFGISREITAATVCQKFNKILPIVFDQNMTNHVFPKCYKDRILVIAAENNAYAQEIYMNKTQIIEELHQELEGPQISNIRVVIEQFKPQDTPSKTT